MKINLTLSSILLFALVTPFIMTYRLSPQTTPYWFFGLIFLVLVINVITDFLPLKKGKLRMLKTLFLWFLVFGVIGSAFISEIIVRHQTHPIYNIHDIILQQEAAIRFLLDGVNPYSTTYFGTPLEEWNYSDTDVNPALYHFVMQPFYLIFSLPFYFLSNILFGFFDGRIPLLFLFLSLLGVAWFVPNDFERKLQFISMLAFNPAMLSYTLEGRSDIFMYSFMFVAFYLAHTSRLKLSGVFMAFAFMVKQSAWPLFPFYFAYIYLKSKGLKNSILKLVPFVSISAVIILPFIIWNSKAFLDSTVFYLSGSGSNSYPISGYGFGMILNELGLIKDLKSYYPFIIWQLLICVPILVFLLRYFRKNLNIKTMILFYGIFLFTYWYFSRYFNNSHLGFLTMIFITAYFWPVLEEREA